MAARGRRPGSGTSATTREAILASARSLFAEKGFERTTIRAVAAGAGVDPALVHHYFGTKDGLLVEAIALPVDPSALLAGAGADPERTGPEVVRRLLGVWDGSPQLRAQMVAMLRTGLSHDHAADELRAMIGRTVLAAIDDLVADDHRELRAALAGSQIAGLILARYVLRVPGLADAPAEHVVASVGPAVQHYLRGDLRLPSETRSAGRAPGVRVRG